MSAPPRITRVERDAAAERAAFLQNVPTSARGIVERAFAGTSSPRAAIKAKCLDCAHFDRAEVADCLVVLCPLHSYRPFQNARKSSKSARGGDLFDGTAPAGSAGGPHATA